MPVAWSPAVVAAETPKAFVTKLNKSLDAASS